MKIYAMRHGQTDWNAKGRIQGRTDIPLNETGRAQAEKAAINLPENITVIFSSPLERAIETAEIINKRFNVEIVTEERLIERNFGDYEGLSINRVDINSLRRWTDNAPTPGGETIHDVFLRITDFLDRLKVEYCDQTVLIVSHGHVLRSIIWYFNGLPEDGKEAVVETPNCGFYEFEYIPK